MVKYILDYFINSENNFLKSLNAQLANYIWTNQTFQSCDIIKRNKVNVISKYRCIFFPIELSCSELWKIKFGQLRNNFWKKIKIDTFCFWRLHHYHYYYYIMEEEKRMYRILSVASIFFSFRSVLFWRRRRVQKYIL